MRRITVMFGTVIFAILLFVGGYVSGLKDQAKRDLARISTLPAYCDGYERGISRTMSIMQDQDLIDSYYIDLVGDEVWVYKNGSSYIYAYENEMQ